MRLIKPSYEILGNIDGMKILKNLEYAGRKCYKSEAAITNDSAIKFIQSIIKRGHESVLEHEKISVCITCDRGVSHEEVRHRLVHIDDDLIIDMEWNPGVSQESTRYCNYARSGDVTFIDISKHLADQFESLQICLDACADAEKRYFRLLELGNPPQIARAVLIMITKTEMVLTANIREWRHHMKMRTPATAHPQMREIMIPLLTDFKKLIPVVFDDINPEA